MIATAMRLYLLSSFVFLSACSGGTTADIGTGGGTGNNPGGVFEVTDPNYTNLADRSGNGTATVTYVVLRDGSSQNPATSTLRYSDGRLSGALLANTDIDSGDFINPAGGEFTRVITLSGSPVLFGAVGLRTANADRPTSGSTTFYNAGWAGMTASTNEGTYVLEGDATFTVSWANTSRLTGDFRNLSGRFSGTTGSDRQVSNVGTIRLTDTVSGTSFAGGEVSGSGIFRPLDSASNTNGTRGVFFGPQADEIGGILVIRDDDIDVTGAFQAD